MTAARTVLLLSQPRPTLDLNFTTGALPSGLTVSGGANGTRINASGVIEAVVTPRLDYSATNVGLCRGLLVELTATNLLLNSKIDGTSLSTQSVTVTAQAYTLSFYGTGTVTLSGVSTAGPAVGAGAYPSRQTLTFTPTAGSLTLTVSGTVQFAQLEAGTFATGFVPTAGSSVARTTDSVTMATAAFTPWFNSQAGTFLIEFDTLFSGTAGANYGILSSGTSARYAYIGNGTSTVSSYDGANVITATGTVTDGATHKVAVAYASGIRRSVCTDGGIVQTGTIAAAFTAGTSLLIGDITGSAPTDGHIRRVRYWPRQLPDVRLQSLTSASAA